jgi:hypothetical protein
MAGGTAGRLCREQHGRAMNATLIVNRADHACRAGGQVEPLSSTHNCIPLPSCGNDSAELLHQLRLLEACRGTCICCHQRPSLTLSRNHFISPLYCQGERVPVPAVPPHQLRGTRCVHLLRMRPQPLRPLRSHAGSSSSNRLPTAKSRAPLEACTQGVGRCSRESRECSRSTAVSCGRCRASSCSTCCGAVLCVCAA